MVKESCSLPVESFHSWLTGPPFVVSSSLYSSLRVFTISLPNPSSGYFITEATF